MRCRNKASKGKKFTPAIRFFGRPPFTLCLPSTFYKIHFDLPFVFSR